jgi:hypothetical protein
MMRKMLNNDGAISPRVMAIAMDHLNDAMITMKMRSDKSS